MIANIEVQVDELPALRSTLRLAQTLVPVPPVDSESSFGPRYDLQHLDRLQHLINEVDRHLDASFEDKGHPEVPIAQVLFGNKPEPDIDETHATFSLASDPRGVACSQCGACSCHPRPNRDITQPCLKAPEVESEHPRGYTVDPSTVITDENHVNLADRFAAKDRAIDALEETARFVGVSREPFEAHWTGEPEASESHFVGIDPGVPDGKPLHFIQNADGTMRLGLRPGETYVGRVRGHNLVGAGPSTEFEITTPEDAEAFETAWLVSKGGWCSPADQTYHGVEIPEVTARRGGISFTNGPDFLGLTKRVADMTKKELRAEIARLHSEHGKTRATLQKALRKERKKTRRLRRIIEKAL